MSLLEDLDHALGQAILHGFPKEKAEKARDVLFEIDNTVTAAITVINEARFDQRQNHNELLSEAAYLLGTIAPGAGQQL